MADETDSAAILHVGSYAKAGGRGLYRVALGADGALNLGEAYGGAANASFAAEASGRWYVVDEMAGSLAVLGRGDAGWRIDRRSATGGGQPCYVAIDPQAQRLAVANYGSGSLALWRLDRDGWPADPPDVCHSRGSGPVAGRQDGPHCHCAVWAPDGRSLYATDLGADAILRFTPGAKGALGAAETAWRAPPGSGPRHVLFHPTAPLAVLVSELASRLTTFALADDGLREIDSRSTLPEGFAGDSLGGHLALGAGGARVYVTNRGHDSIAVFALDRAGRNELLEHVASGGASPRHLLLLEDLALAVVAHEHDGTLASFRIAENGRLAATGHRATVPGACFVLRA